MKKVIIIRYSEIWLKGKNRGYFERAFETNLRRAIKRYSCELIKQSGRYLVQNFLEEETEEIIDKLKKVFGAHTISLAYETASDMQSIFETAKFVAKESGTFKVESHRGDKKYPLTSVEISKQLGGMLLGYNHKLSVDVHNPSFIVRVDIRELGKALVFGNYIEGANGMPVGTAGRGLLLLSQEGCFLHHQLRHAALPAGSHPDPAQRLLSPALLPQPLPCLPRHPGPRAGRGR